MSQSEAGKGSDRRDPATPEAYQSGYVGIDWSAHRTERQDEQQTIEDMRDFVMRGRQVGKAEAQAMFSGELGTFNDGFHFVEPLKPLRYEPPSPLQEAINKVVDAVCVGVDMATGPDQCLKVTCGPDGVVVTALAAEDMRANVEIDARPEIEYRLAP